MYPSVKADLPFRGAPRQPIPINYSIALIMKSCGFTLMGIVWTAFVASAQGTISINMATGTKPRVLLNGVNVVAADNIWLEVLVAGAAGLSGGGGPAVSYINRRWRCGFDLERDINCQWPSWRCDRRRDDSSVG